MEDYQWFYSLEGHNSQYGVCEYRCQNGVWLETKNCCCGSEGDNWYDCGGVVDFPLCDISLEGLVVYKDCYRK